MSYIRTVTGVYDTNKHHYEIEIDVLYEIVWDDPYTEYGVNGKYSRGKVIAQSENLDELCDGFYIDEGNEFSFYEENAYEDFEEAKKDFFTNFDNTSTLYAFIKTSKGLIYVAKMNENGDLELI